MLRSSRSTSKMGLLDGVQSLQGAPAPTRDTMSKFSEGAKNSFGDFGNTLRDGVDNIGEGMKSSVNSIRRFIGDETVDDVEAQAPVQQSLSEEMSSFFNLSMFQRIALFAMCFGVGVFMIFISFSFLPMIVFAPHKFAGAFTMGNVLAIISTWFLVGPKTQLQTMFHPARAVAAGVYVSSLAFVLFAAFFGGKLRYLLVLIGLVVEIVSRTLFFSFLIYAHDGDVNDKT